MSMKLLSYQFIAGVVLTNGRHAHKLSRPQSGNADLPGRTARRGTDESTAFGDF